jgi:hypothetical protein
MRDYTELVHVGRVKYGNASHLASYKAQLAQYISLRIRTNVIIARHDRRLIQAFS